MRRKKKHFFLKCLHSLAKTYEVQTIVDLVQLAKMKIKLGWNDMKSRKASKPKLTSRPRGVQFDQQ